MRENIRLELEDDLLWMFREIRRNIRIEKGTEVFRYLIKKEFEELKELGKVSPRYSHFNVYENRVEIQDNLDKSFWEVYIIDRKLICVKDQSDSCVHVEFAAGIDQVKATLGRR